MRAKADLTNSGHGIRESIGAACWIAAVQVLRTKSVAANFWPTGSASSTSS
jgi:hypothetical protein